MVIGKGEIVDLMQPGCGWSVLCSPWWSMWESIVHMGDIRSNRA